MAKLGRKSKGESQMKVNTWDQVSNKLFFYLLSFIVILFLQFPPDAYSAFAPSFVWSAVNKTLDEDRLSIVDMNNDRVKVRSCVKVVLYNNWSENYIQGNHSGNAVLVNITKTSFATDDVVSRVKERLDAINLGSCVPCVVVISIVNVSSMQQEKEYGRRTSEQISEESFQDYKLELSHQFVKILQFRTPIQARHLVLVRITERKDQLTKCHGKKYTKYPRRLVPLWEQVLFDHFKEARVIQGTIEEGSSENTLSTGKEIGVWVWMCEEINRRLELQERCQQGIFGNEQCRVLEAAGNLSTAVVNMTNREMCGVYRARS